MRDVIHIESGSSDKTLCSERETQPPFPLICLSTQRALCPDPNNLGLYLERVSQNLRAHVLNFDTCAMPRQRKSIDIQTKIPGILASIAQEASKLARILR